MPKKDSRRRSTAPAQIYTSDLARTLRKPTTQFSMIGIAVFAIMVIALISNGASAAMASEIGVNQAYGMYGQEDVFFLDVREPEEWNEYHAPNSTLIPLGELESRVSELPKDKKIVVVCRSGNRSQAGRDILLNAGFTQVSSMAGGLRTWRDAGYPVANGP